MNVMMKQGTMARKPRSSSLPNQDVARLALQRLAQGVNERQIHPLSQVAFQPANGCLPSSDNLRQFFLGQFGFLAERLEVQANRSHALNIHKSVWLTLYAFVYIIRVASKSEPTGPCIH